MRVNVPINVWVCDIFTFLVLQVSFLFLNKVEIFLITFNYLTFQLAQERRRLQLHCYQRQ